MALQPHALRRLAPYMRNASVLCLAYPDILATAAEVEQIFGYTPTRSTKHGRAHGIERPLVDTEELFATIGAKLTCVDVAVLRGCERLVDLNEPVVLGKFDLVIDPGTIEHCFNIGQAIRTAATSVKVGGHIYHSPPMGMLNHGFYNICPTMLWDFYTQNGWGIEALEVWSRDGQARAVLDAKSATRRYSKIEPETGLLCLAKRVTEAPLTWPVQSKYKAMLKAE